jgi:hypothetical protein
MAKNKFKRLLSENNLLWLLVAIAFSSCTYDKNEFQEVISTPVCDTIDQLNFTGKIGQIISTHCALSCHVSGGTAPGNYKDYKELKEKIIDGTFENRVFILKDMPPAYSLGPKTLTECELNTMKAWINAGLPE